MSGIHDLVQCPQSGAMHLRIKELRREKGVTQVRLAEAVGTSQANISAIENGRHNPQLETLERIALALRVSVPDLFEGGRSAMIQQIADIAAKLDISDQEAILTFARMMADRHRSAG